MSYHEKENVVNEIVVVSHKCVYVPPLRIQDSEGNVSYKSSDEFDESFHWSYVSSYEILDKADSVRRKRPVGIELMFNPTNHGAYSARGKVGLISIVAKGKTGSIGELVYHTFNVQGSMAGIQEFGVRAHYYFEYYWLDFESSILLYSDYLGCTADFPYDKVIEKNFNFNKLLLKIKDEKINIGMFVAEWKQTQDMYISAAKGLLDTYRGIRKGQLGHLLARGIKSAPETWLLYRYGVTPHLSDVKAGIDLATTGLQRKPIYKRYSATNTSSSFSREYKWGFDKDFTFSEQMQATARSTDIAFVEFDRDYHLSNLHRLGLANPALLAWEVIPFSFVVDWFVDVGDSLSALDALAGVKRIASTRTSYLKQIASGHGGLDYRMIAYDRVVTNLNSPPIPTWNPSLNWKRLTDIPALLSGLMKR